MNDSPTIGCAGGCGRKTLAAGIEQSGWSCLEITGRYRCGECSRVLLHASTAPGAPPREEVDRLAPTDRGALKELRPTPPLKGPAP